MKSLLFINNMKYENKIVVYSSRSNFKVNDVKDR